MIIGDNFRSNQQLSNEHPIQIDWNLDMFKPLQDLRVNQRSKDEESLTITLLKELENAFPGQEGRPQVADQAAPRPMPEVVNIVQQDDSPKLNNKFLALTTNDIRKEIDTRTGDPDETELVTELLQEMITRSDLRLPAKDFENAVRLVALLIRGLKEGKCVITNQQGVQVLTDEPLPEDRKKWYHQIINTELSSIGEQLSNRIELTNFLTKTEQFKPAQKMSREAHGVAIKLLTAVEIDGKLVRPIDLFELEAKQLEVDMKDKAEHEQKMYNEAKSDLETTRRQIQRYNEMIW